MTAYRDSFERCPRCGIELQDARSARGCPACGGLFVQEGVLTEMVQRMLPPGPLIRLQLAVLVHGDPPIACPSCGETMEQTSLLQLPIERCPKHGVWFDRDELGTALHRTAAPGTMFAAVEPARVVAVDLPAMPETAAPPSDPSTPLMREPSDDKGLPALAIEVRDLGGHTHAFRFAREIIKIGRMASAHLHLPHSSVSRMHAVIEVEAHQAKLIDLGSSAGTIVNGAAINVHTLRPGDEIRIGDFTLRIGDPSSS